MLEIVTVPCLTDNYAYILRDNATETVAVVDAPEAAPILAALEVRGWGLDLLLITHHHADHIQATDALKARHAPKVVGAAADAKRLPPLDIALAPGDHVAVGASQGEVIDVPGHTIGHIAYHFRETGALFTADSLMCLGCGRLFEGTPDMMWDTLTRLAALPPETMVYSGHEYTETNARFALSVDPENAALAQRAQYIAATRAKGQPTVPVSLAEEHATNPFLRAGSDALKASLGMSGDSDVAVFAEVRRRRDGFS